VLISGLINDVVELNLQVGISNSFDAKLDALMAAIDDSREQNDRAALNATYAFINAVEAQRGKKLTDAQANLLVSAARRIISTLGG
jgi:hypothetical protein